MENIDKIAWWGSTAAILIHAYIISKVPMLFAKLALFAYVPLFIYFVGWSNISIGDYDLSFEISSFFFAASLNSAFLWIYESEEE